MLLFSRIANQLLECIFSNLTYGYIDHLRNKLLENTERLHFAVLGSRLARGMSPAGEYSSLKIHMGFTAEKPRS